MAKQPNKTHVFLTLENLVKIFKYKDLPIKLNRVWYEDQIESMREAGVSSEDSEKVELLEDEISSNDVDSENISLNELEETPAQKFSGAVKFTRNED